MKCKFYDIAALVTSSILALTLGCTEANPGYEPNFGLDADMPPMTDGGMSGADSSAPDIGLDAEGMDAGEPDDTGVTDIGVEDATVVVDSETRPDAGSDAMTSVDAEPMEDAETDLAPVEVDEDGDGVLTPLDCDDTDENVFPGAEEKCDDVDNDCDDSVDEEWNTLDALCAVGLGACRSEGRKVCTEDGNAVRCTAVPEEPSMEVCNSEDDDCDGNTDERIEGCCEPGEEELCGSDVGACEFGSRICNENGAFGPCDGGIRPQVEQCNEADDDCDGTADEVFPVGRECQEGIGACAAEGLLSCVDGEGLVCSASPAEPRVEFCNTIDDDCDGRTDEGFDGLGDPCTRGEGLCLRAGITVCGPDGIFCDAPNVIELPEVCNGLDDDCNGIIDDIAPQATVCGIGMCQREGELICEEGLPVNTCVPGDREGRSDSFCDGIDADCDGLFDERYRAQAVQCGIGACQQQGVTACIAGVVQEFCIPRLPSPELCDQIDNDCDELVDEDTLNDCGECGPPPAEICNNEDEDCDGLIDEGVRNECGECGPPPVEVCDAIDNDCDGQTDEDLDRTCVVPVGQYNGAGLNERLTGLGYEIVSVGDMNADGVADAAVSAYDGELGAVALISGADGRQQWIFQGFPGVGASLAARVGENPANTRIIAGAIAPDEPGVVVILDPAGRLDGAIGGDDEVNVGQHVSAIDGSDLIAAGDPNGFARPGPDRGAVIIQSYLDEDDRTVIEGPEWTEYNFGARSFLIPDVDRDGRPDLLTTHEALVPRSGERRCTRLRFSSTGGFSDRLCPDENTDETFGESIVWGQFLNAQNRIFAYGAPRVDAQGRDSGGVYLIDAAGRILGAPFSNGDRNSRQGRRLSVYSRADRAQDALVVGGESRGQANIWTFGLNADGISIEEDIPVSVADATDAFGWSLSMSQEGVDGTARLFVSDPEQGEQGAVYIFSVR